MFRLIDPDAIYPTDVTLQVPTPSGWEPRQVRIHYRMLPISKGAELAQQGNAAFLSAVVSDWEGVEDADGKPIACTPEAIAAAAEYVFFAVGVVDAYYERFDPRKNLKAPPSAG